MVLQGKMIIICAPSGSGKTTIVKSLLPKLPVLEFSVSACSRKPRQGEKHGKDYYFLSAQEFQDKIKNNDFMEWEEVYPGSFYGTLHSEVNRIWSAGRHVIFDVDVAGGLRIKEKYPHNSLAVFIMPPSLEILKQRLINRGTEAKESLDSRLGKAEFEMKFAQKFDTIIINDKLETALEETFQVINNFLNS